MQYARVGNTGLIVSRLSFGVMTFGKGTGNMSAVSKTPQSEATELINRAIEAGINFFDTADMYAGGESEIILGKALGSRRKDVVISTKVGFRSGEAVHQAGASYGYIVSAAEASLKRLGSDYVDLLSIHRYDPHTPLEETARGLENLVQRGLVRYVGYSNFSAWQAQKLLGIQKANDYSPLVAAQMYYSLAGRDLEHEIVPFLGDGGIGLVVWSPLAGGFLTGRYTRKDPSGENGRIADFNFLPLDREKGYELIDRMQTIARHHDGSVAQVALAWLLAKPYVTTILLGASKLSQLEDNLGAVRVDLRPEEVRELDELTAPPVLYPAWFQQKTLDVKATEALRGVVEELQPVGRV
jgi:aryl-alcohol dehydrogenase-like predicted oxidoreductase